MERSVRKRERMLEISAAVAEAKKNLLVGHIHP